MKSFLKTQIEILKKRNITFHSVNIDLKYDEKENKIKKFPSNVPLYKDKKLQSVYDSFKNGLIIPLGDIYDGLIGVDVDNKNDTIDFFNDMAMDNNFDLLTLSVKTINNGMHYYFRLNEMQKNKLKDFTASTALCFSTKEKPRNIDIKYNNQVFFGPSYFIYDDEEKKYEIDNDIDPIILPDYLFQEILRTHTTQTEKKPKDNLKVLKDDEDNNNDDNKIKKSALLTNLEKIERLRGYLSCLHCSRFDNRDSWLTIGAVIFNECEDFELFDEYSKKSEKYDKKGCDLLWNSFKKERDKKVTIKKLIEWAEKDTENDRRLFTKAILKDKGAILDMIFYYGAYDLYMAYLFFYLHPSDFVFDIINENWYCINKNGIYILDKKGDTIKGMINDSLIPIVKSEYMRLLNEIGNDVNPEANKNLFKKYQAIIKYCASSLSKENLLKELRLLYIADKIFEKMDTINPNLVGFINGVYDLENNIFRNAKPEEYVSVTTGNKYNKADPDIKKEAMQILESIFPDKEELRYILKHISLGLYGLNPEEKFYIWIGTGGNGKGLLRDIIQVVFGGYYDPMDISYLYKSNISKVESANPIMTRKKNTRLVITTEPDGDQKLKSSIIKSFSGNDPIQVRELYGSSFNFIPKFKLIIQTNTEPIFEGFDGGMKRRPIIINFPNKFVDNPILPNERLVDKTLKKKLIIEKMYLNEFFEIFVDHYILYTKEGLRDLPKRFKTDTSQFIKNNDPIGEWLDNKIIITNKCKDCIKSSDLYDSFLEHIENENKGITPIFFKNTLSSLGIGQKRKSEGIFYTGIQYKTDNNA
jgi:P4 family phage/plasmid primase-like protien